MKVITVFALITAGLLSGFVNGLFGAGGGVICVLALTAFLKTEKKKAHATTVAVILVFSLISIFFYAKEGNIDLKTSLWCALGGTLGGALGAYLLRKIPTSWVSKIFGILMLISAWRMLC